MWFGPMPCMAEGLQNRARQGAECSVVPAKAAHDGLQKTMLLVRLYNTAQYSLLTPNRQREFFEGSIDS